MSTHATTFAITATAHADCDACIALAENAETMARCTGSTGATYSHDATRTGGVEHSATVARA